MPAQKNLETGAHDDSPQLENDRGSRTSRTTCCRRVLLKRQGHGLVPERLGKAFAGMRPQLASMLKLPGLLVQGVLRVPWGLDLHGDLYVIGLLA